MSWSLADVACFTDVFAGDGDDQNDDNSNDDDDDETQARHEKLLASMSVLSQPSSRPSRKKKERSETVEVCFALRAGELPF